MYKVTVESEDRTITFESPNVLIEEKWHQGYDDFPGYWHPNEREFTFSGNMTRDGYQVVKKKKTFNCYRQVNDFKPSLAFVSNSFEDSMEFVEAVMTGFIDGFGPKWKIKFFDRKTLEVYNPVQSKTIKYYIEEGYE